MRLDWLFLDELTSAVDEKLEAQLYGVLARRLPGTTIVSIGHRSTVVGLHRPHSAISRKHKLVEQGRERVRRPAWLRLTGNIHEVVRVVYRPLPPRSSALHNFHLSFKKRGLAQSSTCEGLVLDADVLR